MESNTLILNKMNVSLYNKIFSSKHILVSSRVWLKRTHFAMTTRPRENRQENNANNAQLTLNNDLLHWDRPRNFFIRNAFFL